MNTARRVQLFLSPVMIAMLCIMLAVVSFGWYQAEFNGQIEVTDSSVDVTVEAPEYIDVDIKDTLGDNYTYANGTFTIKQDSKELKYFGQTGEYSYEENNLDSPYIIFFPVTITSHKKTIDVNSAYVDGVDITLKNGEVESYSEWELANEGNYTAFKVYFYSSSDGGKSFISQSTTFEITEKYGPINTYIGIHFDDPNEQELFRFSDVKYYGSTFELKLKFYNQPK